MASLRAQLSATLRPSLSPGRPVRHVCLANRRSVTPLEVKDSYVYGAEGEAKGICHFIGGAFAGAVPQAIYPVLLRELAENGYTVIATPFPVSFKHRQCAERLRQSFYDTLEEIRTSPIADKAPRDVPLHGIGHSFGALAHALIGCSETEDVASNVLISFNNKEVSEAIPIPGFIEAARAAFTAYDRSPVKLLPEPVPIVKELVKRLLPDFPNPTAGLSRRAVDDGLDQLDSVFGEIRDGVVDFDPVPSDSAQLIEASYRVPATLIVQFANDAIDESPFLRKRMEASPRQNTTVKTLTGTHLTPCIGDIRWLASIADADYDEDFAESIQRDTVVDTRSLVQTIIEWLNAR